MVRINFNRLRFLVIDDNAHMRRIMRSLLHGFGTREVYEAEDGAAGLEAFTQYGPDIVITDWVMPIFDGLELVQMIRQPGANANPYVPIIMLTGHSEKHRVVRARDAGITEFLAKPISATALYERILNLIANPRPFVRTKTYFGPDRRRNVNANYIGPERRKGGKADVIRSLCSTRSLAEGQERKGMAVRKDNMPSVRTFADHEVITPANPLHKAIAPASADDDDPVARAEAALAQLSTEFAEWMQTECERLERARQEVVRLGFTEKTHAELFRAAHDIKGEAATFGYPAVVGAADSLCRLLEHTPDTSRIPLTLVEQHVDAVRAIAREYARADLASVAGTLTRRLREVTDEFLRNENADRPDYLESIFAPTLAP